MSQTQFQSVLSLNSSQAYTGIIFFWGEKREKVLLLKIFTLNRIRLLAGLAI